MRHVNFYSYIGCKEKFHIPKPYLWRDWTFANPKQNYGYVKILKCILENPGLKRREIHEKVFGCRFEPGNRSCLYAVMLWADLIDYDAKFRYTITQRGKKLLKKLFVNSIASMHKICCSNVEEIFSVE